MRRQLHTVLGVLLLSASSLAWAQTQAMPIKHVDGVTVIRANPEKAVVLDLAILDIVHALDGSVAAVPKAKFPAHMDVYDEDRYAKVGTLFKPDLDAISALSPDLIIVGRRSTPAYADLAKIGPTLNLAFDQQNLVESVAQNTRTLAAVYNRQDQAEPLLKRLDASVKELNKQTARAGKGLLVFTTGGKLISQGPGSRFGVLFKGYGVQPAMTDFPDEGKGVLLTSELLQSLNPDWIYVIDRDAGLGREGVAASELLKTAQVGQTTAGKKKQIVYLDPTNWYLLDGAGLTTMQANVDQLLQALRR
jgi:iron complex transport system substrate-binding protein